MPKRKAAEKSASLVDISPEAKPARKVKAAAKSAAVKSASLLDFLGNCSEISEAPKLACSPPRPKRGRRSTCSSKHLTPQPKSKVDAAKEDLWDAIWAEVESPGQPAPMHQRGAEESPVGKVFPLASPTPAGVARPLRCRASPATCRNTPTPAKKSPAKSPTQAIVPYVRRRLVGKQPPVLQIEVYVRRRLRGKQAAPDVVERKTISVRGHYDVLGIRRTVNAAEIHAAYRRRALATHPDKGGDPRDFQRVKVAYEELSDAGRRAAYDRNLVLFGRRDGVVSDEEQLPEECNLQAVAQEKRPDSLFFGAARVAHFTLMASNWDTWPSSLAKMQDGVLRTLRDILKGSKTLTARADEGLAPGTSGNLQGWQGPTCITQRKSGYKVTISLPELSVCTGFTKSLTEVIDWQIALLSMQGAAQLRLKRRGNESKDPLTENELLQVMEREPGLELVFTVEVGISSGKKTKKVTKVAAPSVMDLRTAMEFRRRFLAASRAGNPDAAIKAEKRKAEQVAATEKKRRRICEQKLLADVNQELQARRSGRSRGTADHSSKAIVVHTASQQEYVETPPKAKSKWASDRAKTSPCKATASRKRTVAKLKFEAAPARKQRACA